MNEQPRLSIDERVVQNLAAAGDSSVPSILTAAAPLVADALVALALSGSVQACALVLKLAQTAAPPAQLLQAALSEADSSLLAEIYDLLEDSKQEAEPGE